MTTPINKMFIRTMKHLKTLLLSILGSSRVLVCALLCAQCVVSVIFQINEDTWYTIGVSDVGGLLSWSPMCPTQCEVSFGLGYSRSRGLRYAESVGEICINDRWYILNNFGTKGFFGRKKDGAVWLELVHRGIPYRKWFYYQDFRWQEDGTFNKQFLDLMTRITDAAAKIENNGEISSDAINFFGALTEGNPDVRFLDRPTHESKEQTLARWKIMMEEIQSCFKEEVPKQITTAGDESRRRLTELAHELHRGQRDAHDSCRSHGHPQP